MDTSSPRAARVGRPAAGSENKPERILEEALRIFTESGYAGTSLSQVARAAEISKAGLLHHFGSKAALFSAVLERRDNLEVARFPPPGNPWRLLDAFLGTIERNLDEPEGVGLYLALAAEGTQPGHPAHTWLHRHLERTVAMIADAFEAGKAQGHVRKHAPSLALAQTIVAAADGIQLQWLCARADQDGADQDSTGRDSTDRNSAGRDSADQDGPDHDGPGATMAEAAHQGVDMTSQLRMLCDLIAQQWQLPRPDPSASPTPQE